MTFSWRYVLSLGSNLGDKNKNCQLGLEHLCSFSQILQSSPFMETEALTLSHQKNIPSFMNMICEIETNHNPEQLYKEIVFIEDTLGHSREHKWHPRELDIDILLWAKNEPKAFNFCQQLTQSTDLLEIPHKEIKNRDFLVQLSRDHLYITL